MTSARKIRANRANARASTGPKTAQGRTHSARNALRHTLSLPVHSDPALSEEVEALAREIAGIDANAEVEELARRVAEAQIDLRRVRRARHQFLSNNLDDPYYESRANMRAKMAVIGKLLRPNAPETPIEAMMKFVTSAPQGPQKFATILSQEFRQIVRMDRYERRALSRRRRAIRDLDAARRETTS